MLFHKQCNICPYTLLIMMKSFKRNDALLYKNSGGSGAFNCCWPGPITTGMC